jgi:hypothetical protein
MKPIEKQLTRLADVLRTKMQRRLRLAGIGPEDWKLPRPRICVMEAKRSRLILGWHSPKRWEQGAVKLDEIVLTPYSVSKGLLNAADVLAHELVHLANAVAKRVDTSRQGRYHNDTFRATAVAMGLTVTQHRIYGWCETRLGKELDKIVRDLMHKGEVDPHVFKYRRRSGATSEASLVKVVAACGTFAYVTLARVNETSLKCGICGKMLRKTASHRRSQGHPIL